MNYALVLALLSGISLLCLGQASDKSKPTKVELKLKVLPEKEIYHLNEPLLTRTEFTNRTDRTLCFPEPAQGFENPIQGSVRLVGYGPAGRDRDHFLEHFDGGFPSDDKLLEEIEQRWIKLGPNQIYLTSMTMALFQLDTPGDWRIYGAYDAPVASFNSKDSKERLRAVAEKAGCTPPSLDAFAPVVTIRVVPATY
jgi:hypothetical protein